MFMSRVYTIHQLQKLPTSLSEAWEFFSTPVNLQKMTPNDVHFKIHNSENLPSKMYKGMMIEYTIQPILNLPMYWLTEITHVEPMESFVDEQRIGPYALWHHYHRFTEIQGGVEMTDIVHFKMPGGLLGRWILGDFLYRRVQQIFNFRRSYLEGRFGSIL